MITLRRTLLIVLAALFSAYHVLFAIYSIDRVDHAGPVFVALALFAIATTATLWTLGQTRMPAWLAAFDLAVCVAMPLLVTSQLNPTVSNGHATWYVAAVGTLMTIVAVRRRQAFAWIGVGFLAVQSVVWTGEVQSLATLGVVGSVVWVSTAVVMTHALAKAARDAAQFVRVERQAAQWQAAQEAHLSERQNRLVHTYRLAAPLLTEIVRTGGNLTSGQREECRLLEATMRDEIRGRQLLNDAVRNEVMAARRRGTTVTLLDEGGLDDLPEPSLDEVLQQLAEALRHARADTLIVRTVPRSADVAITVVGLRTAEGAGAEDDVELWLEIPRAAPAASVEPKSADSSRA
jgi:hypothetical protein